MTPQCGGGGGGGGGGGVCVCVCVCLQESIHLDKCNTLRDHSLDVSNINFNLSVVRWFH